MGMEMEMFGRLKGRSQRRHAVGGKTWAQAERLRHLPTAQAGRTAPPPNGERRDADATPLPAGGTPSGTTRKTSFHINGIGIRNGRAIRRSEFLRGAPLLQIDMIVGGVHIHIAEIHVSGIERVRDRAGLLVGGGE